MAQPSANLVNFPKLNNEFGSDPEFFIVSKRYGKVLSAHRLKGLPTTYNDPSAYRAASHIKRDGPAIEFNPEATTCRDDQVPFFFHGLRRVENILKDNELKGYTISGRCAADLSKVSLKNAPEDVSEFGCNPDWDAYKLEEKSPICPTNMITRFAGGHIHIGLSNYTSYPSKAYGEIISRDQLENDIEYQADIAVLMDVLVGFPAVGILGPKYAEDERKRREYYGTAGSFRLSKKTFEYRVLSNTAFALSPILMSMWLGVAKFLPLFYKEKVQEMLKHINQILPIDEVRRVINEHDYEYVWEHFEDWLRVYPKSLHQDIPHNLAQMYNASQEGVIWDDDILFNWGVTSPSFSAKHHAYWGHENGARGVLSPTIFPGKVTERVGELIEGYGFTNRGYNVDSSNSIRKHPSEEKEVKRAWS